MLISHYVAHVLHFMTESYTLGTPGSFALGVEKTLVALLNCSSLVTEQYHDVIVASMYFVLNNTDHTLVKKSCHRAEFRQLFLQESRQERPQKRALHDQYSRLIHC